MSLQYRGNTLFLIVKVWDIYISCRYILLQKKLDLKVVKLYPLHSQGSFVFVHSIRIISLKMSDSTKERFYFIQNKFIWNYFYTIGDYNKYLNTIRRLIGRCNRYFGRWLYFNPSGFRYDPVLDILQAKLTQNFGLRLKKGPIPSGGTPSRSISFPKWNKKAEACPPYAIRSIILPQ